MDERENDIEFIQIKYIELENLKKVHCLDVDLFLFNDSEYNKYDDLRRYKILLDSKFIGIIIFMGPDGAFKKGIRIEHFELLNSARNTGIGKRVITKALGGSKTDVYLTPLDEGTEVFWRKCGFEKATGENNDFVCRTKS